MWEFKEIVITMQNGSAEMKNIYLENKIIFKKVMAIPIPYIKKFSD